MTDRQRRPADGATLAHRASSILERSGLLDPQSPTIENNLSPAAQAAGLQARALRDFGVVKAAGWLHLLADLQEYKPMEDPPMLSDPDGLGRRRKHRIALLQAQIYHVGEIVALGGYELRNPDARRAIGAVLDLILDEMYRAAGARTPAQQPPPPLVEEAVEEAVEQLRELESEAPDVPPPPPPPTGRAPPSPPPAAPVAPKPPTNAAPKPQPTDLLREIRKGADLRDASKRKKAPAAAPRNATSVAEILAQRMAERRVGMGEVDKDEGEDGATPEEWL